MMLHCRLLNTHAHLNVDVPLTMTNGVGPANFQNRRTVLETGENRKDGCYCCYFGVKELEIPFGPESFVFQFTAQNLKIRIYRTIILSCFVWV
jgi:hypothetical protein